MTLLHKLFAPFLTRDLLKPNVRVNITELSINKLLGAKVSRKEIEDVILTAENDKASRVHRFNAYLFKFCWHVINEDITEAIQNFFSGDKLLKEINITSITLITKKYKPIFVYNVMYPPVIPKIIANRIHCPTK